MAWWTGPHLGDQARWGRSAPRQPDGVEAPLELALFKCVFDIYFVETERVGFYINRVYIFSGLFFNLVGIFFF